MCVCFVCVPLSLSLSLSLSEARRFARDRNQYLGSQTELQQKNQAKSASKTTRNDTESNDDDDDDDDEKKKKKKMETEKTSPHPLSLKSILLEAPKETSSAMFDAAFELFSSSRGREEDEQQRQQQQPMVLLRIARAKEKLEAHFRGREEEMEAMAFLEYLKTRVVARVVEKKTGAGEEEEEEDEEEEETRRMRLEKVVESALENNEEDEEENEKARNRLKKILLAKSVAWFEKKSKTRGENDGKEAVDGGSVDDDTIVERLAATNLVGKESDGRRSLGIKTPRLVEYDWTAYATRASSSALESKASHTSSSSSSSSSRFRLSLRVASDGGREDEKENTASREDIQHHDLDLDLDSLAVLVDALRDAKSTVAFGGGKGGGGG